MGLTFKVGLKMILEKRRFKRFKSKKGAFAYFPKNGASITMGKILDMSIGGLSFQYFKSSEIDNGCSAIRILGNNGSLIRLDQIQCRIVYDYEVPETSWDQISVRRCGVEFKKINSEHKRKLKKFINHFAVDPAQSESVTLAK